MGLFHKKEVCPICGNRLKGDVLIKIKDNIVLCKECSTMVNMDAALLPLQSVEDMKDHLKYRQENLEKFEAFEVSQEVKVGSTLLRVDEFQKIWYCTKNRRDKNPPLFEFSEICSFQYLEDGQGVEEESKGIFRSIFREKKEPTMLHSMKVRIELDNPYTKFIDIETIGLNDEVKTGSFAYKSHRWTLEKVLEILRGITESTAQDEIQDTELCQVLNRESE